MACPACPEQVSLYRGVKRRSEPYSSKARTKNYYKKINLLTTIDADSGSPCALQQQYAIIQKYIAPTPAVGGIFVVLPSHILGILFWFRVVEWAPISKK